MTRASLPRLVIDLDGTLTIDEAGVPYPQKRPNSEVIAKLREYKAQGFEIVIFTARNMRTHRGEIGLINVHTLPIVLDWLRNNSVPFDEVIMGKPWCGADGFYVDDKAIRPSEFARLSPDEVRAVLDLEGQSDGGV